MKSVKMRHHLWTIPYLVFVHTAVSGQEFVSDVPKWGAFAGAVEGESVEIPSVDILKGKKQ